MDEVPLVDAQKGDAWRLACRHMSSKLVVIVLLAHKHLDRLVLFPSLRFDPAPTLLQAVDGCHPKRRHHGKRAMEIVHLSQNLGKLDANADCLGAVMGSLVTKNFVHEPVTELIEALSKRARIWRAVCLVLLGKAQFTQLLGPNLGVSFKVQQSDLLSKDANLAEAELARAEAYIGGGWRARSGSAWCGARVVRRVPRAAARMGGHIKRPR
mmetsp:Transcript_6789/g.17496  ORF Transcript_6789/g.17496 Transcript_6789/m.17496 type:complete len:211 (-) Transcript_6789:176-808(-)